MTGEKAKGLIKAMRNGLSAMSGNGVHRTEITCTEEVAEALSVALAALEAQQWIPCEERLPEEEGQYLVTLDFAWGKEIEMGDWFIFEDGHGEWVNPNSHVTVAWMKLPKPWKESEDKE